MPAISYITVTGSEYVKVVSGHARVDTPALVFTGMDINPANPPANQLNIDGTYYPASVHNVASSRMSGAVLDSDRNYRFTGNNGNTTRYVWINEHGYLMAMNPQDGVMNLYDDETNVNAGQGSRLGFVWGYTGISTVIGGNTTCTTCEITPKFQSILFENL